MKFDYCIGNVPYQETRVTTKDIPLYHDFMNAAYTISDKVELITPGRFLFNAGATPKDWNERMLNDEHFKVLSYTSNSKDIFPNTDIKGGIAIHYRDATKRFGKTNTFTMYPELNSIQNKVVTNKPFVGLDTIIYSESAWRIAGIFAMEMPEEAAKLKKSASRFFATNVFDILSSNVFFNEIPKDGEQYIGLYGRSHGERVIKYVKAKYVNAPDNLNGYKVFVPKSNGCGTVGEPLSTPVIGAPVIGATQTFISIGNFSKAQDAENCLKYIKTKFARVMLGILKITQHNKKDTWRYVPLQDFTHYSDIDWSRSIHDIDWQLYKKYELSEEEIQFIETHVKEMT